MTYRHKNGPERDYSPEQLAVFDRHREDRARFRPEACTGGAMCWVEQGPPAITARGHCVGCCDLAGEVGKGYGGGRKVKVAR